MKINWKAVPEAFKVLGKLGEKHLPTILTGLGVAGFIGTAILAAKEAPKAESAIRKAQRDLECPEAKYADDEKTFEIRTLTRWEKVKITAGYYWPSVALGTASTACILSAHKIDLTRLASVTAAYQLSKKDLKELKDKIIEKDGQEKLKEYRQDIHQDEMNRYPSDAPIFNTGKGLTIFRDPFTGRLFYSDVWEVQKAIKHAVMDARDMGCAQVSDLRSEWGLPKASKDDDYEFYPESFSDVDSYCDNIDIFLEYNRMSAGDPRTVIWINLDEKAFNKHDYSDDNSPRYPFR